MFDLEIDKDLLRELELWFQSTPEEIEKALKHAAKKAGQQVRKMQLKGAENRYYDGKKNLNKKNLKVKTKGTESIIVASSKSHSVSDFYTSFGPKSGNGEKLKVKILKNNSPIEMKNAFWGNNFNNEVKIGLWERATNKSLPVSRLKTVTPYQMARRSTSLLLAEDIVQQVFNEALEEAIYKGL